MKLPDFRRILKAALSTVERFPLMICCIIIGTIASMLSLEHDMHDSDDLFIKITVFCILGLPVLSAIPIIAESINGKKLNGILLQVGAAILLSLYFYFTPAIDDFKLLDTVIFMVLLISSILLVSYSPFFFKDSQMGLWQFNRKVVSRFFTSMLYSITLYAGISLAILAIHFLFNIHIREERYGQLFCLIFGLFSPWFWAAGIPRNIEEICHEQTYPKGLKIFVQYILLPLVSLYFIILYVYAFQILILWQLPKGWVSYLVLALSIIGILVFLFIWPVKEDSKNNWVKIYSRYFYILLAPLIILLFVAIGRRISDYGVTPLRYFVLILALWLSAVIIYFVISKKKNIKYLPVSLTILALLTIIGPWGAFKVSKRSQMARLETILEENRVIVDNKVDTTHAILKDSIEVEINQILHFLDEAKELKSLQGKWGFSFKNLDQQDDQDEIDWYDASKALGLRNTSTHYYHSISDDSTYFNFYSQYSTEVKVTGYDYFYSERTAYYREDSDNQDDYNPGFNIADRKYIISFSKDGQSLNVTESESKRMIFQKNMMLFYLELKAKGLLSDHYSPDYRSNNTSTEVKTEPCFEVKTDSCNIKVVVKSFSGNVKSDSTLNASQISFNLLIKDNSVSAKSE